MSAPLRYALYIGFGLTVISLIARSWRYKGLHFPAAYFIEAISVAIAPLPIPVLAEIFGKATQKARLPIFNDAEHRAALVIGAGVLILAVAIGIVTVVVRAFKPAPTAPTS